MNDTTELQAPATANRADGTDDIGWLRDALLHRMKAELAEAERYATDRSASASMRMYGHFFD